jgi:hypothetical protein
MEEYEKRLVEVYEVLKYMPKDEVDKIPEDLKDAIRDGRDLSYEWHYDETKKLVEQDLHTDTIAMLSYINMEYILTSEQKKILEQSHILNDKIQEFKTGSVEEVTESIPESNIKIESNELVMKEEKETFFSKIISSIKKIFNK